MSILQSLASLLVLLGFFTAMGLGVTSAKTAKTNLALVPIFGYGALIGLAYVISANFKISGGAAFAYAMALLGGSLLLRIRQFSGFIKYTWQNGQLPMFLIVIAIPICSLLIPASFFGFKYFYAFVNHDFFYNSQDSWYLSTHNVIEFNTRNESTVPLIWSASFSGRIGAGLVGSFLSQWTNLDTLQFNSLLLNTIVLMFALALSVFSKEFFGFNRKGALLAVFFSVMSAAYVQGYCYYVLGQISTIPVFIVFCIYLKRFLDNVTEKADRRTTINNAIICGLLLNILFLLYAILSFFALAIMALSYFICCRKQLKLRTLLPIISIVAVTILLFCLVRISIMHEAISVFKSWISLSTHVAEGQKNTNIFIVCSEYLTEALFALLFGLSNYPSIKSVFAVITHVDFIRVLLLSFCGFAAFITTILIVKNYAQSNENSKGARAIVIALCTIIILLTTYFFFTLSAYGIFKLQTWFIPILMPIYIYFLSKPYTSASQTLLKSGCGAILVLNLIAGSIYVYDFFLPDNKQGFVNTHGVTGNKDIADLANKLKILTPSITHLSLTNGLETAWLADILRDINLNVVSHNKQPLLDMEYELTAELETQNKKWPLSGLMVLINPNSDMSDITSLPEGGKVVFQNNTYTILDPKDLATYVYLGAGSYPIEHFHGNDSTFPAKFRWVEKGIEIFVYSNKPRMRNLMVELTPGFVDNKNQPRQFIVKTAAKEYTFAIQNKTTLTIPVNLKEGLNRITVESPDNVARLPRNGAIIRPNIPLDPRLTSFAISKVELQS